VYEALSYASPSRVSPMSKALFSINNNKMYMLIKPSKLLSRVAAPPCINGAPRGRLRASWRRVHMRQLAWCAHAAVGVPGIRITELKHAIGLTKLNYVELGHAAVGVPGIRITELKHAIGLTKLSYVELGHAAVGVPGIRITELKHAIGLTKLNYVEFGDAAVGIPGMQAVRVVLKGRPRLRP
jgi:hypothetical protein